MLIAFALAAGFAITLFVGLLAKLFIDLFAPAWPAHICAFCVTAGFVVGKFSYSGPLDAAALNALASVIGAVGALAMLYWRWARKTPANS